MSVLLKHIWKCLYFCVPPQWINKIASNLQIEAIQPNHPCFQKEQKSHVSCQLLPISWSWIVIILNNFFFFFLAAFMACGSSWARDHSSDSSCCSVNPGSLTHCACATRELKQFLYTCLFFILYYERSGPWKINVNLPDRRQETSKYTVEKTVGGLMATLDGFQV